MKALKYFLLASLPAILLSCGLIEQKKAERYVLKTYNEALSNAGYQEVVEELCKVDVNLEAGPEEGSYIGEIVVSAKEGGSRAEFPVFVKKSEDGYTMNMKYNRKEHNQMLEDLLSEIRSGSLAEALENEEDSWEDEGNTDSWADDDDSWADDDKTDVQPVAEDGSGMPSWVYGNWSCTTPYGVERMTITRDLITSKANGVSDSGTYTYDNGCIRASFSRERGVVTSINLDIKNQRLEYGGGYYWVKER